MQKLITILWDNEAKADLKLLFEFIKLNLLKEQETLSEILYFKVKTFILLNNINLMNSYENRIEE